MYVTDMPPTPPMAAKDFLAALKRRRVIVFDQERRTARIVVLERDAEAALESAGGRASAESELARRLTAALDRLAADPAVDIGRLAAEIYSDG